MAHCLHRIETVVFSLYEINGDLIALSKNVSTLCDLTLNEI